MVQLTNRQFGAERIARPSDFRVVVFVYCPVDMALIPKDVVVVPMRSVPSDWRHVAGLMVVIGHDGRNVQRTVDVADACCRFGAAEVDTWCVPRDEWICVVDPSGKVLKPCPPVW